MGGKCLSPHFYNVTITTNTSLSNFINNYANITQQLVNSVDPQNTQGYALLFPYLFIDNGNNIIYMALMSSLCQSGTECARDELDNANNVFG